MIHKTIRKNLDYIVVSDATLNDAMQKITVNHRGCIVVVDKDMLVVGVLSDGDIRRAIVKGATIFTPVCKVMNQKFLAIFEDKESESVNEIFSKHPYVNVIPKVDKKNKLRDLIIRGGAYKG
jgi:CBS domain-containing protein